MYETFTPAAHTAKATGVVAANRAALVDAMHAEGFANYGGRVVALQLLGARRVRP